MMCSSVSFSVATWKSVTENPLSSEPQEKDGAERELEPEREELAPAPKLELDSELYSELEIEPPLETVPEIHFWVFQGISMCIDRG